MQQQHFVLCVGAFTIVQVFTNAHSGSCASLESGHVLVSTIGGTGTARHRVAYRAGDTRTALIEKLEARLGVVRESLHVQEEGGVPVPASEWAEPGECTREIPNRLEITVATQASSLKASRTMH